MVKKNVTVALLVGAMVALAPSIGHGQDRISPALALARVCVSEAGWDCFATGDGFAIHEVILHGAERHRTSYVGFARAYTGATLGNRPYSPTSNRQWVAELAEDGSTPLHWPTAPRLSGARGQTVRMVPAVPWTRYRGSWLAVLAKAREVVAQNTLRDVRQWSPCASEVQDWGGAMDRGRALHLRLTDVDCGHTSNDFYVRPNRVSAPTQGAEADELEPPTEVPAVTPEAPAVTPETP